ncbi:uncharacterized protein PRCAT00004603001 [Priceomyces carsonii]|uniref:uncharacterized protein n=1 Tax=Priceomyces carsonii TaxID=28549 RepID=UPI002ED7E7FB|nr:unnamed protein product [Priceomyces carsonii]
MTTKAERDSVIESLEEEYREDLAIHLYSTFLLHQINPIFPRRNWASWPLSINEVPDPRNTLKYADNIVSEGQFNLDIDKDEKLGEKRDESSESSEDESLASDESSFDSDERVDTMLAMKIRSVSFSESLTNSKADLINELNSLVERKVNEKIKSSLHHDMETSPAISGKISKDISMAIANKVDKVLNQVLIFGRASTSKSTAKRKFTRLLSWQDIIMAGMNSELTLKVKFPISLYEQLYEKCEKLFENVNYNYEFDDDDNNDDDDDDDDEGLSDRILGSKQKFSREEYLDLLEEENSSNATYNDLKGQIHNRQSSDLKHKALKKIVILNKIRNEEKWSSLLWKPDAGTQDSKKHRKRFPIKNKTQDMNELKSLALNHGGLQIDDNDYVIPLN